eukprot:403376916
MVHSLEDNEIFESKDFFLMISEIQKMNYSYSKLQFKVPVLMSDDLSSFEQPVVKYTGLIYNIIYNILNQDETYSQMPCLIKFYILQDAGKNQSQLLIERDLLIYLIYERDSVPQKYTQDQKIQFQQQITQTEIIARNGYTLESIAQKRLNNKAIKHSAQANPIIAQVMLKSVGDNLFKRLEFKLADHKVQEQIKEIDQQLSHVIIQGIEEAKQCLLQYQDYLITVKNHEYFNDLSLNHGQKDGNQTTFLDLSLIDERNPAYQSTSRQISGNKSKSFSKSNQIKLDAALRNVIAFISQTPQQLMNDITRQSLYYLQEKKTVRYGQRLLQNI